MGIAVKIMMSEHNRTVMLLPRTNKFGTEKHNDNKA